MAGMKLSLRAKISWLVILITFTVLCGALVVVSVRDFFALRSYLVDTMTVTAHIISWYCVTPLVFESAEGARDTLQSLTANPMITSAIIYKLTDEPFAQYGTPEYTIPEWSATDLKSPIYDWSVLHIFEPIQLDNDRYGTLYLQVSCKNLQSLFINNLMLLLQGIVWLTLISGVLGWYLPLIITKPVMNLVAVMRKVTTEGDYSVRVSKQTSDEIGVLYDGFNTMLDQIESRSQERDVAETELSRHRDHLEELVTERTEALEKAQEELIVKERLVALGRLTATVSHELRNPLGTLRTSLFSIEQNVQNLGLGVERALKRANRSINRCDQIIEELLHYSRNTNLHLELTDIDVWLTEIVDDLDLPADIILRKELSAQSQVWIDREHCTRCVHNLVVNAYQAVDEKIKQLMESDNGSVMVADITTIVVRSCVVGEKVQIQVIDKGCGIDDEHREKIFEPLFSTKSFGIGLGLPLVQQIIEQHHGGLELISQPSEGTTAVLWVPLTAPEERGL